jgi:hypothetical protein
VRRRLAIALAIWAGLTIVYFACASRAAITQHTAYNHFAHLAKSWLSGRLDMVTPPPGYAANNDFAFHDGKWFIVFPGFPAVILLPAVAVAESVEKVRDGQIFLWLAGLGPALTFLALERLRDLGRTAHDERENGGLALLLGLGTVYFFTAEQGTVWFAAHVVGVSLAAAYALFALDGAHPMLAGLMIALGFWTRTPLLFAVPLFAFEASRAAQRDRDATSSVVTRFAAFGAPIALGLALAFWNNRARFGDPFEFGYRYLTVGWRQRIEHWGLFSPHYLGRNLGVVLTSLPFWERTPGPGVARLTISIHGLALWITTPLYLLLLWPRRRPDVFVALAVTALCVMVPSLMYQNTGQTQFGWRFSNDSAVFLFLMLAVSRPRLTRTFWAIGAIGVAINLFGALSFQRAGWERYYAHDPTYSIYPPD